MKNLMFRGNAYVLHFCLFLLFGLTSCDKEELIPLEEGEFTAAETGMQAILVDENEENGRVYGSVDGPPIVTFHENYNFNGTKAIYRHPSTIKNAAGSYSGLNSSIYSSISTANSMTVAPGCKVTIYDQTNYRGGARTFNNQYTHKARYVSAMATPARSFTYECNPSKAVRGNLCAVVGKGQSVAMYTGSSSGLPVYFDTPLSTKNLKDWGWNNTIESIAFMSKHRCGARGVMLANARWDRDFVSRLNHTTLPPKHYKQRTTSLGSYNNVTSAIVPAGTYGKRQEDFGITGYESSQFYSELQRQLKAKKNNNNKNVDLNGLKNEICDVASKFCDENGGGEIIENITFYTSFGGAWACPEIDIWGASAKGVVDLVSFHWKDAAEDFFQAAYDYKAIEVDAALAEASGGIWGAVRAGACVAGVASHALNIGAQLFCDAEKQASDCKNRLRF
jgi:hypothetical protein